MDAAAAAAAGEWITAAGVFDGVVNLAAESLIATDISGEVTFHRLLDTTPQDFLMLLHARTSNWTKGLALSPNWTA